ncbi:hypothetical protein C0995_016072 [Termitomyces sp. Mi166|nr:hypothetical protein C0995_016072 [Termitomyces sp. Mi166\
MPEDREAQAHSAVIRNVHSTRIGKTHTPTIDSPRRRQRSHVPIKPVDDAKFSKRRKVIEEFYETERTYVEGLELIYSHFLTPIIASLDTSEPLLDRSSLTSIFSNFIDIWNLHRSLFSSLTTLLTTPGKPPSTSTNSNHSDPPPPLSPLLLSHFPYLSLYNPFVTAFPTAISSLTDLFTPPSSIRPNPKYSAAFTTFLAGQESDPRCGKLKLRDWLLTIVQRCPRYLLLLKDLIACTDEEDPEYAHLTEVQVLVSKITLSLNTSLHTHAQTLSLLSLQRATPNLPFQLIVPGRALLKRGPLLQIERSGQPREREFLLFSDCLIWLAGEEVERAQWKDDWGISISGWGARYTESDSVVDSPTPTPKISEVRRNQNKSEDEVSLPKVQDDRSDSDQQEPSPTTPTRPTGNGRRKLYHPPPSLVSRRNASSGGDERWMYKGRVELVDLEVVVTPAREEGEERTGQDRDEWCGEIRQAKAQLLSSLNVKHPNSTLTSSSSTNHLRRSLQALPFPSIDERGITDRAGESDMKAKGKGKKEAEPLERRRKVEHWVPAIWIPDETTSEYCVEGAFVPRVLDGFTFFISDTNAKDDSSKPARACDACYETVFPVIDTVPGAPLDVTGPIHRREVDTLSSLPSWLAVPSLHVTTTPQALMAIEPSSPRSHLQDLPDYDLSESHKRVKARSLQNTRVRSHNQLLDDLEQHGRFGLLGSPLEEEADNGENGSGDKDDDVRLDLSSRVSSNRQASLLSSPRKENTARRHKRFSLPAVALHTTAVTARTSAVFDDDGLTEDGTVNPIKANKRFSLMLGGDRHHGNSGMRSQSEEALVTCSGSGGTKFELGKSIAAGKLGEILARKTE